MTFLGWCPRRVARGLAGALFVWGLGTSAFAAEDETAAALFQKGVAALSQGALSDAVETFEALADHGFVHPDASFDRALSYLGRVRASAERPGDLGRAAAALEETLLARPDDREAETALEVVRAEVARRRSRSGASAEVESRPSLDRAVVGLASESTWATLAALSSLLLTVGLVLRTLAKGAHVSDRDAPHGSREGVLSLASSISVPIGGLLLVAFGLLAAGARHIRVTTRVGVVVSPEAHLVTERGVLTTAPPIPEAARVELDEERGALVHVRWGSVEGWTQREAVRKLAQP